MTKKKTTNSNKDTRPLSADERKRLRQAELLVNVSRSMAKHDTLDGVLETLVRLTTQELGADRGTIFLNDKETGELYSRVALGNRQHTIRIINNKGIAGHVFTTGENIIIHDAYADDRFNQETDQQTGYETKSIICVPIKTVKDEIIGVCQALNKREGKFSDDDIELIESMSLQAAAVLKNRQTSEKMQKSRDQELEFLDIVADITSEIDLGKLLQKVMGEATRMLNAERSTLFVNDEKTNELFSQIGEGIGATEIRFPNHMGIAGAVFTSGKSINMPHAYADLRFNPSFDKQTGFFTRSILCVPLVNKNGKVIGVTQMLNKRGGAFTNEDEARLKAFTAQVSIALENAKLFNDVQNMKNYSESMLDSMSNGVITLDEKSAIVTCNSAVSKIFNVDTDALCEKPIGEFLTNENEWLTKRIQKLVESQTSDLIMDAELIFADVTLSVNITLLPLNSGDGEKLGSMVMVEDVSAEKRMKATMSRYIDPRLADQLIADEEAMSQGHVARPTVLFSDIRGFTTLTEELGATGTVSFLNDYFTRMYECINKEEGMIDKFIGDAIMAAFGTPIAHDDDEDRALRAGIEMIRSVWDWNDERAQSGLKRVDMGLGLNTDDVVCGEIGSPKFKDLTMIGDGVNLAARLESACKSYSARILISGNTQEKLRGTYRIRDIDDVIVKGKTKPVRVYEVLDYHTAESFPNIMDVVGYFSEARECYRNGNWDHAIKLFNDALHANPNDHLSKKYIERCNTLKENPPEDWNGVFVMTTK